MQSRKRSAAGSLSVLMLMLANRAFRYELYDELTGRGNFPGSSGDGLIRATVGRTATLTDGTKSRLSFASG